MMPHEYEREIKLLKDRLIAAELKFHKQLIEVENKQVEINFNLADVMNGLRDDIKKLKEPHGQTNLKNLEGSQEGRKGHKKVAQNGQETR